MASSDPFRVLGITPTMDRAVIKRAYFGLLHQHSPHADPVGFRRIRDAYELLAGDGLTTAFSTAELDIERELQAVDAQLGERIAAAQQASLALEAEREGIAAFTALLSLTLADASARCELPRDA
ncbi:J domain-containing protein [Enhygromyxa salina]|uniref:DnaJ domain protein n=1 Tax=Enhygromyxa salina TaxID=215803 RepID=A0A2S9YMG2_9BACT|nr:J domain-containing protein [Enhygromyxa salina]PRQ06275.1 DnaJ domain protein [Enhygromyxa salina]